MLDLKNSTYADIRPHRSTLWHRFELWMINDGKMYTYFGFWVLLEALLFSLALVNYRYYPLWQGMDKLLGGSFMAARAGALVLHVNTALVLLPVCRTTISWIRTTPLNRIIPFDHALLFHRVIGYSIALFMLIHAGAHYRNYYLVSKATGVPYWRILFTTGHSITGHIMLVVIAIMAITGHSKIRGKHFNLFWNLHHLFVVYFACFSIHGGFCLLKKDLPPFCSTGAGFYKYWIASGVLYLFERLAREIRANVRAKHMRVQKVILHPGKVLEVQYHKPLRFKSLAGQYAFLNCPAVSTEQWHPFTLTSAPEEDYVSMHIRVTGDWTRAFANALGARDEHWTALELSLGSVAGPEDKVKKDMAPLLQQPPRDSMVYTPMARASGVEQQLPSTRASRRRTTMLLVDQSDHRNPFSSTYGTPRGSGIVSRLSQYLGGGSSGPTTAASNGWGSTTRSTMTAPFSSGAQSYADGSPMPKLPSLKQLQEYYLRSGTNPDRKMPPQSTAAAASQEYEMAELARGSPSAATIVPDSDMTHLSALVNDEHSLEWDSMPVAGDMSQRTRAELVAHQTASILPQVLVDGPFGSASEDVFNHEIAMLFCAGIGCTPFASVLKSIWYKLSYPGRAFRLRKVYFFWVQRDTASFEWFQDLLKAIEEGDDARMVAGNTDSMIEIHTYLTGNLSMAQMTHVHMNVGEVDPITGLRSPTNFGRPNLDLIFRAVAHEHPASDVGVFFCGPHKMGSTIETAAKKWSGEGHDGTKFFYNKENF
ncbi:hypothetical protein H4R19_000777 [Coemansia spiralis]|nr:hypothetical protein H4R19_000777 [Coemansia spiralis]